MSRWHRRWSPLSWRHAHRDALSWRPSHRGALSWRHTHSRRHRWRLVARHAGWQLVTHARKRAGWWRHCRYVRALPLRQWRRRAVARWRITGLTRRKKALRCTHQHRARRRWTWHTTVMKAWLLMRIELGSSSRRRQLARAIPSLRIMQIRAVWRRRLTCRHHGWRPRATTPHRGLRAAWSSTAANCRNSRIDHGRRSGAPGVCLHGHFSSSTEAGGTTTASCHDLHRHIHHIHRHVYFPAPSNTAIRRLLREGLHWLLSRSKCGGRRKVYRRPLLRLRCAVCHRLPSSGHLRTHTTSPSGGAGGSPCSSAWRCT